jgi:histone H3/H4
VKQRWVPELARRAGMPPTAQPNQTEPATASPVKPAIAKRNRHRREFAIPRGSFRKLVHEIAAGFKSDLRFQGDAIDALQESAERLLLERFERCAALADLCKLDTVRGEHWRFVEQGPTLLG